MPSWEVALGCAGKRKKSELTPDAPTSRRTFTEDVTTCHLYSGCEIPFPLEEAAVSAAPTREGSFRGMHRSSVPEVPLFSATPRQTDLDLVSENAEVVPWTATCSACCAPITGTVYMGFDRAFCSAAACHKGLTATGSPLPIRVRISCLVGYWHWATTHTTTHDAIPTRFLCHTQVHLIECGPSRPCDGGRDLERNIAAASSGDRLTLVQIH